MPWGWKSDDKVTEAAEEYAKQLGEIYKHECFGSKKRESCHQLADFYMAVEHDIKQAKEVYRKNCEELDFAESCHALGVMHLTQKEFKDPNEALRLFNKACQGDSSGACNNAGLLYQNGMAGLDEKTDIHKAMELFDKACKGKHRNGCFNLSIVYLTGKSGIPKDMTKAFELSMKSCQMGHPWGCANISRMYATGDGVVKNAEEAARFKRLAKSMSQQEL